MTQRLITPDIIANEALMQLENNLVMGECVYRDYSKEFTKVGESINVRRPVQFTVTDGAPIGVQDVEEGNFSVSMDKQKHVAWAFNSKELTLTIDEYSERYIKPAMIQLANRIDKDLLAEYKNVWNWVGDAGQTINSYADFAKGPERLDETAVPDDMRKAVLAPADSWALAGSQTSLFFDSIGEKAYRKGEIGEIGGVKTYKSQNVATHTCGSRDDTTPVADTAAGNGVLSTTYNATADTDTMILSTDGWDTATLTAGDVFTIDSVYAVNPVSKETLTHLQQFVVKTATATASSDTEVTISPPIITSGPYQTVSEAAADGDAIVNKGTASTGYRQNMCFHKNAFALVMRDLILPDGVEFKSRKSHNGYSMRVVKQYDIRSDEEVIRLDVLYGTKCLDARLATRMSGTS